MMMKWIACQIFNQMTKDDTHNWDPEFLNLKYKLWNDFVDEYISSYL